MLQAQAQADPHQVGITVAGEEKERAGGEDGDLEGEDGDCFDAVCGWMFRGGCCGRARNRGVEMSEYDKRGRSICTFLTFLFAIVTFVVVHAIVAAQQETQA